MPQRRPAPASEPKHFTAQEIPGTLTALQKRIDEVQKLIEEKVHEEDPVVGAVEKSIRTTIARHFGAGSREGRDNDWFRVDRVPPRASANLSRFRGAYGIYPGQEQQKRMGDEARRGYEAAIVELKALK